MTITDRIRESEQPGFNLGMLVGEQERVELEAENARLQAIVDSAVRYVMHPVSVVDVTARGSAVFGKRWMEITGFKPQPAKDAT